MNPKFLKAYNRILSSLEPIEIEPVDKCGLQLVRFTTPWKYPQWILFNWRSNDLESFISDYMLAYPNKTLKLLENGENNTCA